MAEKNSQMEEEVKTSEKKEEAETVETSEETEEIQEEKEAVQKEEEEEETEKKDSKKEDAKDKKIAELNDRLLRSMAEFDNFRKRSEKEKSQMFEIGARDIIEKILPVLDNFERGLDTITEEEKSTAFAQGIEQIYKQFVTVLGEAGVKTIEAVGKEFDPNFHNAVMHGEDEEIGENMVVEEYQKGYMYKDTVVRHSMVKVVN